MNAIPYIPSHPVNQAASSAACRPGFIRVPIEITAPLTAMQTASQNQNEPRNRFIVVSAAVTCN